MAVDNVHSALLVVFVVLVLIIYFILSPAGGVLSASRPPRFRSRVPFEKGATPDLRDVAQQLHAVMAAPFQRQRLLSRSEYDAFKIIEDDLAAERRGYRVFAQTCLGEVLRSPNEN